LRTSSYTIYVDLPGNGEEMLLVHTYTGAFDRVSRRVATYVRSLEASRPPKPLYGDWTPEPSSVADGEVTPPSEATIEVLCRRGYLTPMSGEEEEGFFARYVEKLHGLYLQRWPTYLFMPTYDCNLRCGYCFQDHMRTDSRFGHLLRQMTPAMVDRLFAAMPNIEALHGIPADAAPRFDIGFFGGEPLLAANRPIVEHIIRRGRDRGEVRFWAISNGTELDAYEDLLSPDLLASVQITLDGPPEAHDRRRVYADGQGSWEKIARNVAMALERGVQVAIRTNVDRTNLDGLAALAGEIVANGWDRFPNFSSQVAPIRASNDRTDSGTTLDTWELDRHLTALRDADSQVAILGRQDDTLRHQARRIFSQRGLPAFKPSFCSAHTGMYIFDPFGDIYACWEKTGDEKVRIGHVGEDSEVRFNFDLKALWQGRTVASNPVCLKCRYNLFCGGGCAVLAAGHSGGDFYRNYCDGFAHRFRASVAEAYLDHAEGKAFADRPDAFCDL
jgi:uncharacterized protein